MMIFFFPKNIIKILIHSLFPYKNLYNIINLKIIIYEKDSYNYLYDIFKINNSQEILKFLFTYNIFGKPKYSHKKKDTQDLLYVIINEEEYNNSYSSNVSNYKVCGIKAPQEINFSLVQRQIFRGLDNVGATCYMNATLQCLANIKPITEYLLNPNKYSNLYNNIKLCIMTLKYVQVLLGLFCNEHNTGSYCPKDFKDIISDYNPLFEGVKANDSKDLIIFLLEILNNELVKVYNKRNTNNNENENYQKIDISDENAVFNHFSKDFQKNYCSIIGYNLYGFQKNLFVCQNCHQKSINFNIFNLLIFGLEAISNYFNLSNNNSMIPIITFDHCFQFLSRDTIFLDTYCQYCKKTVSSNYKETIYYMPNYLIIILNMGKGYIFNCNVQIPESFSPSIYVEKEQNIQFNLIGIVSHFGESGMGGHFIAFCKSYKDNKWRCYNDSIVTECQNDYLKKGTPYILFYKKELISQIGNNLQIINNNLNMNQQNINNICQLQNSFQNININNNNNFQQQNQNMNLNVFQQQNMNINNNFQQQNMNINNNFQQQTFNYFQQQQIMNMSNNNMQQQNLNLINNNFQNNNNNNFQYKNSFMNNIGQNNNMNNFY